VIKVGGNGIKVDVGVPEPYFLASDAVRQFDLDGVLEDQWTTLSSLNTAATDCNMVLLPNGKLLVLGGGSRDHEYVEHHSLDAYAVRATQQFDPYNPGSGWAHKADMPSPDHRWYHSTASLLPDGSVLSAGSNQEFNGRIYYPDYYALPRPVVVSAPSEIHYGTAFNITASGSPTVSKVTMLRLTATTHGFDQGQRYIRCDFSQAGNSLTVTPPADGGVAPPGYYMVFAIDQYGAPSYARYAKVGP
jgi:hypothetical protein